MKPITGLAAFLLCLTLQAKQQPATGTRLAFEVASIKPGDLAAAGELKRAGESIVMGCHGTDSDSNSDRLSSKIAPEGRCVFTFIPLRTLINIAYQLETYQLTGAPDWISSTSYHIEAKADGPATVEQLRLMLQTLLTDRFKLKAHPETREMVGLGLVIAKSGAKLHEARSDENQMLAVRPFKPPIQQMVGQHASMAMLVKLMTSMGMSADRGPTIDKTGLNGFYDFQVIWQPEGRLDTGAQLPERVGPTLPAALEEQLGIRVENTKNIPVDLFVLDHIEKPTEE